MQEGFIRKLDLQFSSMEIWHTHSSALSNRRERKQNSEILNLMKNTANFIK